MAAQHIDGGVGQRAGGLRAAQHQAARLHRRDQLVAEPAPQLLLAGAGLCLRRIQRAAVEVDQCAVDVPVLFDFRPLYHFILLIRQVLPQAAAHHLQLHRLHKRANGGGLRAFVVRATLHADAAEIIDQLLGHARVEANALGQRGLNNRLHSALRAE